MPRSASSPARADEGDDVPRGIETLYRSERNALMRFIARRGATDEASDIAQEAFVRLAQNEDFRTDRIARPAAYLRQIVRNLLRDRAKAASRRDDRHHLPHENELICPVNEIARLEARDGLARVEAAMRLMKPRTRDIFMAHRRDGLTYGEIAERTGMSVKGVEKQMSRAIAHLMRHVDLD